MFRSIADQAISLQMDMQLVQTDLVKGLDTAPANISGSGPTLLYIALPHSPSGWIPTKETYKQLAEWSVTQGAPIVVDMVYDDFLPDRTTVLHPMHFELGLEDLYIVNSVSKNYGAPGARIGWIASSESNIERLTSLLEQQCIAVSSSSQGYAAELLAVDNGPLREVVERGRKAIMTTELALDLRITGSTAGVQCVFECADVPVADLADHLLRNYGLLVATSENYAQLADSVEFVRLPLGYPEDVVRTASALIQRGYLDLRGDLR
jgi:beta-methylarginine biosynthesis bifunctional aminotransferase